MTSADGARIASERAHAGESERAFFHDYCNRQLARWVPRACAFFLLMVVALWPLDWILHAPGSIERVVMWDLRILLCLVLGAALVVARFTQWFERAPLLVSTAVATVCLAVVTSHVSRIGDLSTHWFYTTHFACTWTVPCLVPLRHRLVATTWSSLVIFAGYFAPNPSYLDHPDIGVVVGQLAFATACGIAMGHAVYALVVQFVGQQRTLQRDHADQRELNELLSERVAEKTTELRQLTTRLTGMVEEERAFLAREVHDGLGQELTAMRYGLAYARKRANARAPEVDRALGELDHLLDRTRETTRRIVARLRPEVLTRLGLDAGTRSVVEDLAGRANLNATVEIHIESAAAPHDVESAVFHIVQEAVTNVVRHADATQLHVQLALTAEGLVLTIRDNGVGLAQSTSTSGVGMIGIRERVRSLGGQVNWSSADGGGTCIVAQLPLPCSALAQEHES